jgi:glutaredoxin
MSKDLVLYTRTASCPFVALAKRVLDDHALSYREIFIDLDDDARQRVLLWTGFLAVPTIIAANPGHDLPAAEPHPLERGASPRGVNRGTMITEPSLDEFTAWLEQNGFIENEAIGAD